MWTRKINSNKLSWARFNVRLDTVYVISETILYRSDDPTSSVKALKENNNKHKKTQKNTTHTYKKKTKSTSLNWYYGVTKGDGQAWTEVGLPPGTYTKWTNGMFVEQWQEVILHAVRCAIRLHHNYFLKFWNYFLNIWLKIGISA